MNPYFAGGKMSIADISAAVAVTFIKKTNPDLFSDAAYPKLAALTAKCEAMPEFQSSPLE
jgi:glutathione S-transferase